MAALTGTCRHERARLAGIETEIRRGGTGAPLLVIHGEHGAPGWLEAFERLAAQREVIVPSLPGYGCSERPDWVMSVRDLAVWVTWFARDLHLDEPVDVIGFSMGGWIAAELATVAPQFFNRLVLIGAAGVKPQAGEIFDYFLESGMTGLRRGFHDADAAPEFQRFWGGELSREDADRIEQHREMTCRIVWKPYMHSLTLPDLLPGMRTPTLLIWGEQDRIVPLNAARIYQSRIPGARLDLVADCGHMVEMEKPEIFASLVNGFLGD